MWHLFNIGPLEGELCVGVLRLTLNLQRKFWIPELEQRSEDLARIENSLSQLSSFGLVKRICLADQLGFVAGKYASWYATKAHL